MPEPEAIARSSDRYLVFSASLPSGSLNTTLAALTARTIIANGGDVDLATTAGPEDLQRRLTAAAAFVICSPEYNASMPGQLKNVIDWVSRHQPQPFNCSPSHRRTQPSTTKAGSPTQHFRRGSTRTS